MLSVSQLLVVFYSSEYFFPDFNGFYYLNSRQEAQDGGDYLVGVGEFSFHGEAAGAFADYFLVGEIFREVEVVFQGIVGLQDKGFAPGAEPDVFGFLHGLAGPFRAGEGLVFQRLYLEYIAAADGAQLFAFAVREIAQIPEAVA